ncbi:MAG: UPF0158 family protein [Spirochaetia bacterium]
MEFEISPEIIDQIIFGMENQEGIFYLDTRTLQLVTKDAAWKDDMQRYLRIPEWRSVDGFNLMEQFVASLRNPIVREELRQALSSGKGVFRNFKDVLRSYPSVEKLWYIFKDRSMRRKVIEWYNSQMEAQGLERIGPEPEDNEQLLLSDFTIKYDSEDYLEQCKALDWEGFLEMFTDLPKDEIEYLYSISRKGCSLESEGSLLIHAEAMDSGLAGFLWADETELSSGTRMSRLLQLYVVPQYRGLGIGRLLLERYCSESANAAIDKLYCDLQGKSMVLLEVLREMGFLRTGIRLSLDVSAWETPGGIEY